MTLVLASAIGSLRFVDERARLTDSGNSHDDGPHVRVVTPADYALIVVIDKRGEATLNANGCSKEQALAWLRDLVENLESPR